ncbi:AraC family transcriptional regulator [Pelagibaculum spongiae]|nr:AraC family transcriptional regulator [Pelagibaculum spongiae]
MPFKRGQETIVVTDDHSLSADYLVASRDFALSRGVSAAALLNGSDLSLGVLLNPPPRISYESLQCINANMMNALGSYYETAVDFGRFMEVSTHGLLGMAVQSTGTLLEASGLMLQYMKIRTSVKFADILPSDDMYWLRFTHDPAIREKSITCLKVLFEVAILVSFDAIIKKLLVGRNLSGSTEMRMTVAAPEQLPVYLKEVDSLLYFDQPFVELGVPAAWMALPLGKVDEELGLAATELCESALRDLEPKDIVARLRDNIQHIEGQKPSLKEISSQMHMSVSTLQRRLKEQGVTFQQLKAEAQLLQAKELLINDVCSLDDISSRLGFSDSSNFSKSFKSWTGQTPTAFRNAHSSFVKSDEQ